MIAFCLVGQSHIIDYHGINLTVQLLTAFKSDFQPFISQSFHISLCKHTYLLIDTPVSCEQLKLYVLNMTINQ